ncbi:MAG TPA: Flp family type IVb pilin [Beijerinckiaceae bacterium]|jgi:pilus assembly protein Flp/PilA
MRALICRFGCDERATTSIEYAFLALLIAVAIVAALTALGTKLGASYNSVVSGFQ